LEISKKFKLGIALSGGGARGFAHLGILKAFEEENIKIDCLSGTSFGALVACLYASGHSVEDILKINEQNSFWKLFAINFKGSGLLSTHKIKKKLTHYLPHTFQELQIPVFITAICLETVEILVFNEDELIAPLVGSLCLPLVFKPLEHKGHFLYDGGFLNNLPTDCIRPLCNTLVGVHTNLPQKNKPTTMKTILEKSLQIAINSNAQQSLKICDIGLQPPEVGAFKVGDFKKARQIFELGYIYTKNILKENKNFEDVFNK
jgi:NTE family protein